MKKICPEEVEQILKEDSRFAAESYQFVSEALEFTMKRLNKPPEGPEHHITAAELLEGIRQYALQEFGPLAMTVMNAWGIHQCKDFGCIVFNLVNKKIFGKTEEDSPDDFNDGFDFEAAFRAPFEPEKKLKMKNEK